MKSFLRLLAQNLIQKYDKRFEQLTIIFPNKRAGLFLADELSALIGKPVWMPEIITLDEFITQKTGLKKIDDLPLVIKLYKSYCKTSGVKEKFEDFYFWGNMLLGDFDDIDKYLVDAKAIFSNLVALKELEHDLPYLTSEQLEAIRSFWQSFNPEKFSKEQREFLKTWDKLYPTYIDFKQNLISEHLCFEGMGQRFFCEHIEEYRNYRHIIFAGFNALNTCEKKIFSFFRDNGTATFYWDYDLYYVSNENHEAGHYIKENLKLFPNGIGLEHFNNFQYNGKKIEYISVPSGIGQAKLIPKLTKGINKQNNHDSAIVLCDERMLIPVIHSIPDHIEKINITMGYPAQNTSVAALISLLGDLQNYRKKEKNDNYYYYKPVIALLNHKLIKETCPDDINNITNYINTKNIVYVSEKSLHFNETTRTIFSIADENIPSYLLKVLSLVIRNLDQEKERQNPIEKEFIFTLFKNIQCLQNTFKEEQIEPEDKLYIQIINKVINSISVPFSGEPLEGLQLMGLMETRMLDFKNLIILSANEGILPKNSTIPSFIPYNLRFGFKLPTPEHQDALFAYYFYRLLQRAENIKILYSSVTKGTNSSEMSRFLYQIKYEAGLSINEYKFQNQISVQDTKTIEIIKNEEITEQLNLYTKSEEITISPSALNTYMECSLRFYFKYIAKIEEKEEMTEELDHRLLGNIFHECSQSIYNTVHDGYITTEIINSLLQDNGLIDEHIRRSYTKVYDQHISNLLESGNNELILNVIKKYIREMLKYDKNIAPFQLIAMEKKYTVPVEIKSGCNHEEKKTIYIGGVIDRVDRTDKGIRVIDYKTGSDTTIFKNFTSIFDTNETKRNKAAFQTLLYCMMFGYGNTSGLPLHPGIYSTKLLFGKDYDYRLKCDKDPINDFALYKEEFQENLVKLLEELYSPAQSFRQTDNDKKCRTCPYAEICRK